MKLQLLPAPTTAALLAAACVPAAGLHAQAVDVTGDVRVDGQAVSGDLVPQFPNPDGPGLRARELVAGGAAAGSVTLSPGATGRLDQSVTLAADGQAVVGDGATLDTPLLFVNPGGRLELGGGAIGSSAPAPGTRFNSGTSVVLQGGALVGSGSIDGTLFLGSDQNDAVVATGQTLRVTPRDFFSPAVEVAQGELEVAGGTLEVAGGGVVGVGPAGRLLLNGGAVDAEQVNNEGALEATSGQSTLTGTLRNDASARLTISPGASLSVAELSNQQDGVVRVEEGGELRVTGSEFAFSDLTNDGRIEGGGTLVLEGTLDLDPFGSPLGLNGVGLELTDSASVSFFLDGDGSVPTAVDLGGGGLTLGGELELVLDGDLNPVNGDSFALFRGADGVSGSFAGLVVDGVLGEGLSFDLSSVAVDGTIRVVPEPASAALLIAGGAALLGRRRR